MISDMEVRDVTIRITLSPSWVDGCVEALRRDPYIDPPAEAREIPSVVQDTMEEKAQKALARDGVGVSVVVDENAAVCTWTAKYSAHPETPLNNRDRAAVETAFRATLASLTSEDG